MFICLPQDEGDKSPPHVPAATTVITARPVAPSGRKDITRCNTMPFDTQSEDDDDGQRGDDEKEDSDNDNAAEEVTTTKVHLQPPKVVSGKKLKEVKVKQSKSCSEISAGSAGKGRRKSSHSEKFKSSPGSDDSIDVVGTPETKAAPQKPSSRVAESRASRVLAMNGSLSESEDEKTDSKALGKSARKPPKTKSKSGASTKTLSKLPEEIESDLESISKAPVLISPICSPRPGFSSKPLPSFQKTFSPKPVHGFPKTTPPRPVMSDSQPVVTLDSFTKPRILTKILQQSLSNKLVSRMKQKREKLRQGSLKSLPASDASDTESVVSLSQKSEAAKRESSLSAALAKNERLPSLADHPSLAKHQNPAEKSASAHSSKGKVIPESPSKSLSASTAKSQKRKRKADLDSVPPPSSVEEPPCPSPNSQSSHKPHKSVKSSLSSSSSAPSSQHSTSNDNPLPPPSSTAPSIPPSKDVDAATFPSLPTPAKPVKGPSVSAKGGDSGADSKRAISKADSSAAKNKRRAEVEEEPVVKRSKSTTSR